MPMPYLYKKVLSYFENDIDMRKNKKDIARKVSSQFRINRDEMEYVLEELSKKFKKSSR